MLKVYFGYLDEALDYPDFFFERLFDKSYLLSDFSRNIIWHVDKCKVFDKNVVISDIFGGMSPNSMSTGVKNALICRYYPDRYVYFSHMGSNCLGPLFKEIVKENLDRTVCANILYIPYTYGYEGKIEILNNGHIVDNGLDSIGEWVDWKEGI